MTKLKANNRDSKTKLDAIREEGSIPAVFYGPKQESTAISMKEADFKKAYETLLKWRPQTIDCES